VKQTDIMRDEEGLLPFSTHENPLPGNKNIIEYNQLVCVHAPGAVNRELH
jgi:hypothetical protein